MSESNEHKTSTGGTDPKTAREAQQRKAEKRSNVMYGTIAVIFLLVAVASIIWRSNIIPKTATAVTINGEKYTAAEVNFYYQNVYQSFLSDYSSVISYLGLNTNASLKSQTLDESTAEMLGAEAGSTWHDFFLNQALQQMATIQATLDTAEEEGFIYPEGVQVQYEDSVAALEDAASSNGMSANKYLQANMGSLMTERVYNAQILRMLKYSAYVSAYQNSLTYTDEQMEEAYQADTNSYDRVSYESVSISGAAESTTDADGNTVDPTEEEQEAAKTAAENAANEMLAAVQAGGKLETLASANDNAKYSSSDAAAYGGDTVTEWLFDSSRKAGDSAVLNTGTTYYVVVFHDRFREEYPTIDIRHILIAPESTSMSSDDEGYDEEVARLKAEAKEKADDLLAQWKSGEATEESFAKLAMENSADGSKYDGGLYTEVYQGQMVPTFNDWCFDASRKSGDTDVVETDYGAHVMYFVGTDLLRWQSLVAENLRDTDSNSWYQEMSGKYTAEQHDFAMKFVG